MIRDTCRLIIINVLISGYTSCGVVFHVHVRKTSLSALRSFRDLLLSGDETSALKCVSDLDISWILQ